VLAGVSEGNYGEGHGTRDSVKNASPIQLRHIIASDVSLLVTFNHAIDGVVQNNPKTRANPKAVAQLDGYKRPLVSSVSGNLQRFGFEKASKTETLQDNRREYARIECELRLGQVRVLRYGHSIFI
jgi:hypothetical protein